MHQVSARGRTHCAEGPKLSAAEQIVGRERRGRVSHHDWFGDA